MTRCKTNMPRAQKGETLAEVLVAMLIVAVSALLLAAMTAAAAGINLAAHKQDAEFYAAMTKVEAMDTDAHVTAPSGTAVVIMDAAGNTLLTDDKVEFFHDGDLTLYREVRP